MFPIAPYEPDLLPWILAAGSGLGILVALGLARADGHLNRSFLVGYVSVCVAAFAGAKLGSIAERAWETQALSWELSRAYRYPGGIAGGMLALAVVAFRHRGRQAPGDNGRRARVRRGLSAAGRLADVFAPAAGITLTVLRVGCFLAGCCGGHPSTMPWSVRFAPGSEVFRNQVDAGLIAPDAAASLPVQPLQLYFAAASLGAALLVLARRRTKSFDGELFLLFVVSHEALKFVLEYLRYNPVPGIQLASLGLAVLAAVLAPTLRVWMRDNGATKEQVAIPGHGRLGDPAPPTRLGDLS